MLAYILKKYFIFLILIFSLPNISLCGEILYPKNNSLIYKKTIHLIGITYYHENIKVFCNNSEISINKNLLIKNNTIDGIQYLFKVDINLQSGENIISVSSKTLNKTLILYYNSPVKKNNLQKTFFHMNEKNRFCKMCHKYNNVKECKKCHSDKADAKFIHGPVATWQCFICHAKNNYFVIKKPLSVQCLKCHQEFSDAMYHAKFAHPPAIAGNCTLCHNPHTSSSRFFLNFTINKICEKCHENKKNGFHILKKNNKAHIKVLCTKCHNAHYGETRYLFVNNIVTKKNLCKRCHK